MRSAWTTAERGKNIGLGVERSLHDFEFDEAITHIIVLRSHFRVYDDADKTSFSRRSIATGNTMRMRSSPTPFLSRLSDVPLLIITGGAANRLAWRPGL